MGRAEPGGFRYASESVTALDHDWIRPADIDGMPGSGTDPRIVRVQPPPRATLAEVDRFLNALEDWYDRGDSAFAFVMDLRLLEEVDGEQRARLDRHMNKMKRRPNLLNAGSALVIQSVWIRAIAKGILAMAPSRTPVSVHREIEPAYEWAGEQLVYSSKLRGSWRPSARSDAPTERTEITR